jgi:hypothetical protein
MALTRRQALAALTSLPGVGGLARADVKPTSVIVVELERPATPELIATITDQLHKVWPNNRVIVCAEGVHLRIVEDPWLP